MTPPRRYMDLVERVKRNVTQSAGDTTPALRGDLVASQLERLPANLRAYVDKVRDQPSRIDDADVAALKSSGYSEDQIFEITASAAIGAAFMRLDRALAALEGRRIQ